MDFKENKNKETRQLLFLALYAGRIMLRSGAETYRVEDTIVRICKSRKKIKYADAFVTPTGIFVSLEDQNEMISYLARIRTISTDLMKINLVNDFSREFVNSDMSIDVGIKKLKKINKEKPYPLLTRVIFGSFASAFFSLLFGGVFLDFIATFFVGLGVLTTVNKFSNFKSTFFVSNFIGASLASVLALLLTIAGIGQNMDIIIIGSIMPLVPGVPITNAMRDTISGDFLSGLSRGMEAVFSALAIAFGVGIVLNIYFRF